MKALVIALALFAVAPAWAEEPTGYVFRNVPWGATEQTLKAKVRIQRCSDSSAIGERFCTAAKDETIGPVTPQLLHFTFRDDKLVGWSLIYAASAREGMRPALLDRFGNPHTNNGELAIWKWSRAEAALHAQDGVDVLSVNLRWDR